MQNKCGPIEEIGQGELLKKGSGLVHFETGLGGQELINDINIFLIVLGAGSLISGVPDCLGSGEGPLSSCRWLSSY